MNKRQKAPDEKHLTRQEFFLGAKQWQWWTELGGSGEKNWKKKKLKLTRFWGRNFCWLAINYFRQFFEWLRGFTNCVFYLNDYFWYGPQKWWNNRFVINIYIFILSKLQFIRLGHHNCSYLVFTNQCLGFARWFSTFIYFSVYPWKTKLDEDSSLFCFPSLPIEKFSRGSFHSPFAFTGI